MLPLQALVVLPFYYSVGIVSSNKCIDTTVFHGDTAG